MKKYTLLLLVLLLTGNARAQQYEKNILGVRAGLNVSKLTVSVEDMRISTGWRTGFHFAVSDQVLLTRRLPLYLETGVDFRAAAAKSPWRSTAKSTRQPRGRSTCRSPCCSITISTSGTSSRYSLSPVFTAAWV